MEPFDLKKKIGEWIQYVRNIRVEQSQDVFGEKLGIHKQQISRYECGINLPDQEKIDKIAEYGDLPFDQYIAEQRIEYKVQKPHHKKILDKIRVFLENNDDNTNDAVIASIENILKVSNVSKKKKEKGGD